MVVARKSAVSRLNGNPQWQNPSPAPVNPGVIPLNAADPKRGYAQAVPVMPTPQAPPLWLLRLCILGRRSSIVTFFLVGAALIVYGGTVYYQELWGQAYRKLQTLQRHERQLTTTNETLKNQMALQAERPGTEMVPQNPASAIFLNPTLDSSRKTSGTPASAATNLNIQIQQRNPTPLGY
jgi:hypothetical protein